MSASVHIVATGARTPLGLDAASSAAACRAGISAMGEHPFMVDRLGDPMPGALDTKLDPGLMGSQRLLTLAESALREASAPLGELPKLNLRMPVYLALPELRPGFREQDARWVGAALERVEELPFEISKVNVATQGHAAGLVLLSAATDKIREGSLEACLVGGVDSYFQPETMEWLDENRQLAGADARSAFVPGEGAGFCLLMSDRVSARLRLGPVATVDSTAVGTETSLIKAQDICLGKGLTATVQRAVLGMAVPSEPISDVICDINGERYRGEEWGFVCLRLSQHFDDPTAYWSPAGSWGDTGAASAPLFAMLACEASMRGYARGPLAMLWAGSEGGLRGAAVLRFEIGPGYDGVRGHV